MQEHIAMADDPEHMGSIVCETVLFYHDFGAVGTSRVDRARI
jgi:hypothetical protein